MTLDTISKDLTRELAGRENYEFRVLCAEIKSRVKIGDFCYKDNYELKDLIEVLIEWQELQLLNLLGWINITWGKVII